MRVKVPHAFVFFEVMSLPLSLKQPILSSVGDAVRQSEELRT